MEDSSPSKAIISTDAVRHNVARLRQLCGVPVMAVVKADGFGLGAERVARAALAGGATELGVATCEEALALRSAGVEEPILAWLIHDDAPLADAVNGSIRLSMTSVAQLEKIANIAATQHRCAEIELELETGMHRSGAARSDWEELFAAASDAENRGSVRVIGVWTHLAGADRLAYSAALTLLDEGLARARRAGLRPRSHAASSVPAVADSRTRRDVVRLGASLFGIEPQPQRPLGLRPVLRWESRIAQVRQADAGAMIGYERHRAVRPTRLGLIPIGYADGLPRRASAVLNVSVGEERFPFLGVISMDQAVIDLGDSATAVGDRVTLIGDLARGEPSLAEWANALDTIPQEILTGLGSRVARVEEVLA
ncbi:MAG: alanine racemase [Microbacterium sp.]|uniref:alanine racemase n=1 Tax=Microbacterium sp. TaxID=51671 RepID=UPI003F9505F2